MSPRPKHIEFESLNIGDIFDESGDNDEDEDDDDDASTSKHLVLVGGGHAHVQVINSQYDAAYACREHSNVVDTKLAAQLLLRDDDQVNYKVNWKILRDMVCMATYREQVLEHWHTAERIMLDVVAP